MDKRKETKTYRFEIDVIKHAEQNPLIPSFSEWACDRYRREFMEIETLAEKMNMYFQMANDCKDRLQELKEEKAKGEDLGMIKPHELNWIRIEGVNRVKKATFEGVYKAFINQFNRPDINRKQFRLLIDRFDEDKTESF